MMTSRSRSVSDAGEGDAAVDRQPAYGTKRAFITNMNLSKSGLYMPLVVLLSSLVASTGLRGATTITAASPAYSDVSAAVASAPRGATVVVPAGSATWSSSLSITKGINLQGAGYGNTIITASGGNHLVDIVPDSTVVANDEIVRVEGFTFDGGGASQMFIDVECVGTTQTKAFKNLVIGKNLFRNSSTAANPYATVLCHGQIRGCVYSNIFDRCDFPFRSLGLDAQNDLNFYPLTFGSADSLFFEGNTVQFSSSFSGPDAGVTQTGWGGRLVFRYNTWNMANATTQYTTHDVHGYQNFGNGWSSGQSGTEISEYYGNSYLNISGGGEMMSYRGGWMLEFNNTWTGGPGQIHVNQFDVCPYCSGGTIGGQQGCTWDVPGAAAAGVTTECTNAYFFNNLVNGVVQTGTLGTIGAGCGIAENRNFWNYNGSFNGTTGIGRGTTAPGGSPSFGVAYWVASTATPTTDPNVIQNGTLYQCLNAGTWVAAYKPYTFPHPLQNGGASTNPTTSLSANSLSWVMTPSSGSSNQIVTVRNLGGGTLTGNVSLASSPSAFSLSGSTSYSVSSNTTATITVTYTAPTGLSDSANTLVFHDNGGSPSVSLTGNAPRVYVWPLGDSITQGYGVPGGYRWPLYQLLVNIGVNVAFVGNTNDNSIPGLPFPNHDGYGGYEIGDTALRLPGWVANIPPPKFVLLMTGINDFRHNDDIQHATNRLESLIVQIATNLPNAAIIVADLNPWTNLQPTNALMDLWYNPYLPGVVARQAALGRNVSICDMRGKLSASDLQADNTHPNQIGCDKIATNWFLSIKAPRGGRVTAGP